MAQRDRFPYTPECDRVLQLVDELDPADCSKSAEYLREVAQSVRDHRETDRRRNG